MENLYTLPTEGAEFDSFCGGNGGTSTAESCVGVAAIPGAEDAFLIQDTKPEGVSAGTQRYTGAELDALAVGWVKKRGLTV